MVMIMQCYVISCLLLETGGICIQYSLLNRIDERCVYIESDVFVLIIVAGIGTYSMNIKRFPIQM